MRGVKHFMVRGIFIFGGQFLKGVREPGRNMEKLTKIYFVTLKNYLKEIRKMDNWKYNVILS